MRLLTVMLLLGLALEGVGSASRQALRPFQQRIHAGDDCQGEGEETEEADEHDEGIIEQCPIEMERVLRQPVQAGEGGGMEEGVDGNDERDKRGEMQQRLVVEPARPTAPELFVLQLQQQRFRAPGIREAAVAVNGGVEREVVRQLLPAGVAGG